MNIIGKVIGGLLGLLAARVPGALLGLLVGHQFDRRMASRGGTKDNRRRRSRVSSQKRQQQFFEATFAVMGHLAKADGRVSEDDIAGARDVMRRMHLGEEEAGAAMALFNQGKRPDYPIDDQVDRFNRYCGGDPQLLLMFLEVQIDVALVKGAISQAERELLGRIADRLGVGRLALLRIESALRARRRFAGDNAARQAAIDLGKAYEALGLSSAATDAEVKVAYRRLMNEHHPDKQASRGLPPALLRLAEDRTREIRAAYEAIRDNRGFR